MDSFDFKWKNKYELNIPEIDEQHKSLMEIAIEIHNIIETNGEFTTDQDLINIIIRAREYASYHFYTEEKMMEECHYPKIEQHKKEHQLLLQLILDFDYSKLRKNMMNTLIDARGNIEQAINAHVHGSDMEFGRAYRRYLKLFKHMDEKRIAERKTMDNEFGTVIKEFDMTVLYLHWDQQCKGHSVLVNKEKYCKTHKITTLEKNTFNGDMTRAASAIMKVFKPDDLQMTALSNDDNRLAIHFFPMKEHQISQKSGHDFKRLPDADYQELASKIANAL